MHPGTMLLDAVRAWSDYPTPSATEYGSSQNGQNAERPSGSTESLWQAASRGSLPGGTGVLSPVFVEALMGWPLGWTAARPEDAMGVEPWTCERVPFPPGPHERDAWAELLETQPYLRPAIPATRSSTRHDRLRACGNGVVPQQAAAAFTELFEALELVLDEEEDSMGKNENTRSTDDGVRTPQVILDAVRKLGPISFDPCSHPASIVEAMTSVLLPKYWTDPDSPPPAEQECGAQLVLWGDGLKFDWGGMGLTYVNPPYSKLSRDPWIAKARDEADEAVLLLPVRTAGVWWQEEVTRCQAITFLRGRLVHEGEEAGAPFHQCLVYCGPRVERWLEIVAELDLGWTVLGDDWKRGV